MLCLETLCPLKTTMDGTLYPLKGKCLLGRVHPEESTAIYEKIMKAPLGQLLTINLIE